MDAKVIVVAVVTAITLLLLAPPFIWHFKSRNIPALCLITSFIVLLLKDFINLIVWSGEDFDEVWDGTVYCDIAIKLETGAYVGRITAIAALALNLLMVLRASSTIYTGPGNWKKWLIDLSICLITPIFVMATSYHIQSSRYFVLRYRGCVPSFQNVPAAIPLNFMWTCIWAFIAFVLACLTLLTYFQKRKDVSDILRCTNSGLNLKRFARLLIFCFLIVLVLAPLSIYYFVNNAKGALKNIQMKYDRLAIYFADYGMGMIDLYTTIALSFVTFLLFGVGSDAVATYKGVYRRFRSDDSDVSTVGSKNTKGFPNQEMYKSEFMSDSGPNSGSTYYGSSRSDFKFLSELVDDLEGQAVQSPSELEARHELEKDPDISDKGFGYNFHVTHK